MESEKSADIVLKPSCQNHPSLDVDLSEQRFVTATLVALQVAFLCLYYPRESGDRLVFFGLLCLFFVEILRCFAFGRTQDASLALIGRASFFCFGLLFFFSGLYGAPDGSSGLEQLTYLLGIVWPGFLLGIYGRSWDRETMYFSPHRKAP